MIELPSAQEQLGPLHEPLVEAHKVAVGRWAELIDKEAHLAVPLDATTRANYIHDHICKEVELRIDGFHHVKATDALGFFALRIGTEILLRFKYVGHGFPHNVKTGQQKLLARQTYDTGMLIALTGDPALVPPTLLSAGYTLDGTTLGRLEIRRDCKGHLPWHYDIYGGTDLAQPIVLAGLEDETKPAVVVSKRVPATGEGEEAQAQ